MSYRLSSKKFARVKEKIISYMKINYNIKKVTFLDYDSLKKDSDRIDSESDGIYYPDTRKIYVRAEDRSYVEQLITLLHECGHVVTISNNAHNYHIYYSNSFAKDIKEIKSNNSRIDLIREEIVAWEEGFKLNKELRVNIPWNIYGVEYSGSMITLIESLNFK